MRILYLSQLVPFPPDAGPKVRIYHTIRYLVDAGHQVTVLAQNSYDAIYADQLWTAHNALAARKSYSAKRRFMTVLDQHNSVFLIPRRLSSGSSNPVKRAMSAQESRRLAKCELETCHLFDHVVWVTAEDLRALKQISNGNGLVRDSKVIPICVDPETRRKIIFKPSEKG